MNEEEYKRGIERLTKMFIESEDAQKEILVELGDQRELTRKWINEFHEAERELHKYYTMPFFKRLVWAFTKRT